GERVESAEAPFQFVGVAELTESGVLVGRTHAPNSFPGRCADTLVPGGRFLRSAKKCGGQVPRRDFRPIRRRTSSAVRAADSGRRAWLPGTRRDRRGRVHGRYRTA